MDLSREFPGDAVFYLYPRDQQDQAVVSANWQDLPPITVNIVPQMLIEARQIIQDCAPGYTVWLDAADAAVCANRCACTTKRTVAGNRCTDCHRPVG